VKHGWRGRYRRVLLQREMRRVLDIHLAYLFENKGERMLDKIPKILV
jgi:hypothetical protein